ncbi:hypothetical protein QBC44DRAFT_67301 [Cladorrhinum sp. PSN332]|nr:hypothetical protein QBC44DRAFT_67301 [Cladorrhinum sp. PSN332]
MRSREMHLNRHPPQPSEEHRAGASNSQLAISTPCESPQLDFMHGEGVTHLTDFVSVDHDILNSVEQVVYHRPVFDSGLLSPSCPSYPEPTAAPFIHLASTTAPVESTWSLESSLSGADDQSNQANYLAHHAGMIGFPASSLSSEWLNPSTYQGHGHMYPSHTGLPAATLTFSPTFVAYALPPTDTVDEPGRHKVKKEPSFEVDWKLEVAGKAERRSSRSKRKPTRPPGSSGTDERNSVAKKKAVRALSIHPAPIQPSPNAHSPLPPRPPPARPLPPTRASLRTATRKNCPPVETCPKPGESNEDHHLRTTHNQVEQKYRLRVQTGFEGLIQVLPSDSDKEEDATGIRRSHRRLSKADVLAKTTRHVISMGEENKRLKKELEELRAKVSVVKGEGSL